MPLSVSQQAISGRSYEWWGIFPHHMGELHGAWGSNHQRGATVCSRRGESGVVEGEAVAGVSELMSHLQRESRLL